MSMPRRTKTHLLARGKDDTRDVPRRRARYHSSRHLRDHIGSGRCRHNFECVHSLSPYSKVNPVHACFNRFIYSKHLAAALLHKDPSHSHSARNVTLCPRNFFSSPRMGSLLHIASFHKRPSASLSRASAVWGCTTYSVTF